MKELVVISGKGGTGKTSISASFAVLADRPVIADCDVDAADLHLLLTPEVNERHEFRSGRQASIRQADCFSCGLCASLCRFEAIRMERNAERGFTFSIDPISCEGCGVCVRYCPEEAIDFEERRCGEWMVSDTRCGPMVHARLGVAAENSGKLVSTVRRQARRVAEQHDRATLIVDGPPGVGCHVIASLTGATRALIVAEPTVSGEHDLERALALTKHFNMPASVCINKWDLNPVVTERIEEKTRRAGAHVAGRVRYDTRATAAQIDRRAVVETDAPSAEDIVRVWKHLDL